MSESNVDNRSVKEILLDIEKRLPVVKEEKEKPRVMTFVPPLSERARIALEVVLDDIKAKGKTNVTLADAIRAANEIEAGCLAPGGKTNESIRAFCSERCGLRVVWGE
jgi:hypothetical protein